MKYLYGIDAFNTRTNYNKLSYLKKNTYISYVDVWNGARYNSSCSQKTN